MTYGPEERALLESQCLDLYDEIVTVGGFAPDDPRLDDASPQRPALDLLISLGLVRRDSELDRWVAEDPSAVQTHVVTPLSQEANRLLEESSQWSRTFASLGQSWRRGPVGVGQGGVTYLRDSAIGPYLTGLVNDVEKEILTAQPQTGRSEEHTSELQSH